MDSKLQRVRETVDHHDLSDLLDRRRRQGWSLVAVEWQRPQPGSRAAQQQELGTLRSTDVPYGLQVAHDFLHLEENPLEVEAMILMLDSMVDDASLSQTARALNDRGLRTRHDEPWTQSHVFDLMPRIVEAAPDIFGTENWRDLRQSRKQRRLRAV